MIDSVHVVAEAAQPYSLLDLETSAAKYPPLPLPKEPAEKPTEALEEMRRYLEKKYK